MYGFREGTGPSELQWKLVIASSKEVCFLYEKAFSQKGFAFSLVEKMFFLFKTKGGTPLAPLSVTPGWVQVFIFRFWTFEATDRPLH